MKKISAWFGLAMMVYVVFAAFNIGVWGSLNKNLNAFGVSGFFWFFFLFIVVLKGAALFSGGFGLNEERSYSHTDVSVSYGSGTAKPVYLSARDRFANKISGLISLASIACTWYVAVFLPEKGVLQAINDSMINLIARGVVKTSADIILFLWAQVKSLASVVF